MDTGLLPCPIHVANQTTCCLGDPFPSHWRVLEKRQPNKHTSYAKKNPNDFAIYLLFYFLFLFHENKQVTVVISSIPVLKFALKVPWYFIGSCHPHFEWCQKGKRNFYMSRLWSLGTRTFGSTVMTTLITRFIGPTWSPSGADRTQVGPMLAPWTLLSG